jgi:hypothetical protein
MAHMRKLRVQHKVVSTEITNFTESRTIRCFFSVISEFSVANNVETILNERDHGLFSDATLLFCFMHRDEELVFTAHAAEILGTGSRQPSLRIVINFR